MAGHVLRGPKLVGYGYKISDRNDKVAMKCLDKWKQVYRERNKKNVLLSFGLVPIAGSLFSNYITIFF